MATLGNFFFYSEQFLDRQHVVHVVGQWREVIQSIRIRDELVVGHALGDLFIAAMQVAYVRFGLGDDFPVHLQPQSQDSVSGGVGGAHVQHHLFALHIRQLIRRTGRAGGRVAKFNVLFGAGGGHDQLALPILWIASARFAAGRIFAAGEGYKRTALKRRHIRTGHVRDLGGFAFERKIFA